MLRARQLKKWHLLILTAHGVALCQYIAARCYLISILVFIICCLSDSNIVTDIINSLVLTNLNRGLSSTQICSFSTSSTASHTIHISTK